MIPNCPNVIFPPIYILILKLASVLFYKVYCYKETWGAVPLCPALLDEIRKEINQAWGYFWNWFYNLFYFWANNDSGPSSFPPESLIHSCHSHICQVSSLQGCPSSGGCCNAHYTPHSNQRYKENLPSFLPFLSCPPCKKIRVAHMNYPPNNPV